MQVADAAAALRLVHVMRGDDERDALSRQLKQQIPEFAAGHRIDPRRRLIEEHQPRAVQQGTDERQPLLPPPREATRAAVEIGFHSRELDQLGLASFALAVGEAVDAAVEVHVLLDGEVGIERELLRHVADRLPDLFGILLHVSTQYRGGPLRERQEPTERTDQRRLAGPIGPEQAEHFPRHHVQADLIHSRERAEADGNAADFNDGSGFRRVHRFCCLPPTAYCLLTRHRLHRQMHIRRHA